MAIGIYKITNTINNKFYIGSSVNLTRRKAEHKYRRKLNIIHNSAIRSAVLKYGEDNFIFEILETVDCKSKLQNLEQYYIDLLNPDYNIRKFAQSNRGIKCSESQLQHLRTINLGKKYKEPRNSRITLLIDILTNDILEFTSAKLAADFLNCGKEYVSRLALKSKIYKNKYLLKYKENEL